MEQDDGKPKRITVTKEAKRLAAGAINKLPITPEQRTTEEMKTLNKFNSFLSSLNRQQMPKQGKKAPNGRAPKNWFRGAVDMPPDSLI